MASGGIITERMRSDIDRLVEQNRGLQAKLDALNQKVDQQTGQLQTAIQAASQTTGVSNLVNNSDFAYSELGYYGWSWSGSGDVLSQWYRETETSFVQIDENDSVAISTSGHQLSATSSPSFWDKTKGVVVMKSDDAIYAPLPKNYALPGISLFIRFASRTRAGTGAVGGIRFRVSIWENTPTPKIAESAAFPALTLSLSPAAAAGGFTRQYILVSVDSQQRQISSPIGSQSINVSAAVLDNSKYVNISWTRQKDAIQYLIYRTEDGTNWYQIASLQGGVTDFSDKGGSSVIVPAPGASMKAKVVVVSVPVALREDTFTDISVRLKVPTLYPFITSSKQFMRIDCVDADGNVVTLGGNELEIDRVLLATSLGKWTPSPADAGAMSGVETTTPPPVDDNPFNPDAFGPGESYRSF